MARKATAQDVADLAGVSRSAVSLVLNGRGAGNISEAKQQAIREAAAQLNYSPNAVALSLRSQRTRTLGVLTWPGRIGSRQLMLHRAIRFAGEQGYLLLMVDTDDDREVERRQLETLRDRQVDGFLVVAPEMTDYQPPEELLGTPTVLLNCADPQHAVPSVVPDEVGAGRRAAETLLAAGHRRLGVLAADPDGVQTRLRVSGLRRAVDAADRVPSVPIAAGRDIDDGFAAARGLLRGKQRPTALVCTHERLAVGVMAAAADLGLSVPDTLSVVSFEDGERLAARLIPPLTTVQRPDGPMVEQAVSLLLRQVTGPERPPVQQLLFDCPLQARASVAPPPG